jgi:hypothetical protein
MRLRTLALMQTAYMPQVYAVQGSFRVCDKEWQHFEFARHAAT